MVKDKCCCVCNPKDNKGSIMLSCEKCPISIHKNCYLQLDILKNDLASKNIDTSSFLCTKCSSESKVELKCLYCNKYKPQILKEYYSRQTNKNWYHISCIDYLHNNKIIELLSSDYFIEAKFSIKIWLEDINIELTESDNEKNQYEIDQTICQVINENIERNVVLKSRFTKNQFIKCILILIEKKNAYDGNVLLSEIFSELVLI